MALSKGNKSKSYTKNISGSGSGKTSHGTEPMKGGQKQGSGGRGNATRGMTMGKSGKDHKA